MGWNIRELAENIQRFAYNFAQKVNMKMREFLMLNSFHRTIVQLLQLRRSQTTI